MTGVEILSSAQVATEFTTEWSLAVIAWIIVAVLGMVLGYFSTDDDKIGSTGLGTLIGILIGICVFWITATIFKTPIAYETQYKITISDEVSMNEFYEYYEIIDQEGKIFTVREREQ